MLEKKDIKASFIGMDFTWLDPTTLHNEVLLVIH